MTENRNRKWISLYQLYGIITTRAMVLRPRCTSNVGHMSIHSWILEGQAVVEALPHLRDSFQSSRWARYRSLNTRDFTSHYTLPPTNGVLIPPGLAWGLDALSLLTPSLRGRRAMQFLSEGSQEKGETVGAPAAQNTVTAWHRVTHMVKRWNPKVYYGQWSLTWSSLIQPVPSLQFL